MRTIVHISDLHFGRHDNVVAEALHECIVKASPDLLVVSGDLTQRARHVEFTAARAFLDRMSPVPMVIVPGNHDVPLYDVVRRFVRPLGRFRRLISPIVEPFFADDEIAVLGINTARSLAIKSGRISFEQMDKIRRTFETVPHSLLKALVIHHPLAPTAHSPDLDRVGRWRLAIKAIEEVGIHLIFSGHHHRGHAGELTLPVALTDHTAGAVLAIHAGTAISTRTRNSESNTFNILRTEGDHQLAVAMWSWNGRCFVEESHQVFALKHGRWQMLP
jgi:3',5'-cyclic AMP phosphodiesterase CpdA